MHLSRACGYLGNHEGMKRRTITWTAGGVFLIWEQPISARDFRSELILTGCTDVRLPSVDGGRMENLLVQVARSRPITSQTRSAVIIVVSKITDSPFAFASLRKVQ
jgi:hypothetical protein